MYSPFRMNIRNAFILMTRLVRKVKFTTFKIGMNPAFFFKFILHAMMEMDAKFHPIP